MSKKSNPEESRYNREGGGAPTGNSFMNGLGWTSRNPEGTTNRVVGSGGGRGYVDWQEMNGPTQPGAQAPAAPTGYDQLIREQLERLLAYYDPQGQYARNMSVNSANHMHQSAYGRGLRGPMSATAGRQAVTNTLQGVAGLRDGAVQGILGLGSGRDVDLQRLQQNQSQFESSQREDTRRYDQQYRWQTNPWNAYAMPILGGLMNAGGQVAGAYLSGGASLVPGLASNVPGTPARPAQNPAFPQRGTMSGGEPINSAGW